MRPATKILGVIVPVLVVTTLCLSVPFIIMIADAVLLAGAVVAYVSQKRATVSVPSEDLGVS
jgi:hypothetical protein